MNSRISAKTLDMLPLSLQKAATYAFCQSEKTSQTKVDPSPGWYESSLLQDRQPRGKGNDDGEWKNGALSRTPSDA